MELKEQEQQAQLLVLARVPLYGRLLMKLFGSLVVLDVAVLLLL
jgi:hypothetical protein